MGGNVLIQRNKRSGILRDFYRRYNKQATANKEKDVILHCRYSSLRVPTTLLKDGRESEYVDHTWVRSVEVPSVWGVPPPVSTSCQESKVKGRPSRLP